VTHSRPLPRDRRNLCLREARPPSPRPSPPGEGVYSADSQQINDPSDRRVPSSWAGGIFGRPSISGSRNVPDRHPATNQGTKRFPLLGERVRVRADVYSSRRDYNSRPRLLHFPPSLDAYDWAGGEARVAVIREKSCPECFAHVNAATNSKIAVL